MKNTGDTSSAGCLIIALVVIGIMLFGATSYIPGTFLLGCLAFYLCRMNSRSEE